MPRPISARGSGTLEITLQTDHHESTSPRFASTQRNHASWPISNDFCNPIAKVSPAPNKNQAGHGIIIDLKIRYLFDGRQCADGRSSVRCRPALDAPPADAVRVPPVL